MAPLRALPRATLFVPRVALRMLLGATEALTDWAERSGLVTLARQALWAWDGRLRIAPWGGYRSDVTPMGGAWLATDLLFGKGHRAGLVAEGAYGASGVWRVALRLEPLGQPLQGRPTLSRRAHLSVEGGYETRADTPFLEVGYRRPVTGDPVHRALFGQETAWARARLRVGLWRDVAAHLESGYHFARLTDGPTFRGGVEPISLRYGTDFPAYGEGLGAYRGALGLSVGGRPLGHMVPSPGLGGEATASLLAGPSSHARLFGWDLRLEAFGALAHGTVRMGVRAWASGVGHLKGAEVPLLYLPHLGGLDTMRGFSTGRFRGETLAWIALEHYAALHPRLWLSLFLDWGGAWREAHRTDHSGLFSRVDLSGGGWLGLRLAPGIWLQLQVAGSREGAQIFAGVRSQP